MKDIPVLITALLAAIAIDVSSRNDNPLELLRVTPQQQAAYRRLQEGRFKDQFAELPMRIDEITAAFFDVYCGNGDRIATCDEGKTFKNESYGQEIFYAIVCRPKKRNIENNILTNHPFDYRCPARDVVGTIVFPTQSSIEEKISELIDRFPELDEGDLNYVEVRARKPFEDRDPVMVSAYFKSDGKGGYGKTQVLGFDQKSGLAKSTASAGVVVNGSLSNISGFNQYEVDTSSASSIAIPLGNTLEHVAEGNGNMFVVYVPDAFKKKNKGRRLFIGRGGKFREAKVTERTVHKETVYIKYELWGKEGLFRSSPSTDDCSNTYRDISYLQESPHRMRKTTHLQKVSMK
jgi:hypothetical protein